MRNVILIGAFVGLSASVPIVYQASPDTFHRLVSPAQPEAMPQAASIERAATPAAAAPNGRRTRVEADGKGHFSTEIRLNGRRIDGLIDTGATYLAFNQSTARRAGIAVSQSDFRHTVNTANGKAKAAVVEVDTVEIGKIRVERVQALVLEDRALKGTLVGMNVLKSLRKVEVSDGVMLLEQ